MIIFSCSPPDDEAIRLAKLWIQEQGYTQDDVSLIRNSKYVAVKFKEESTYE